MKEDNLHIENVYAYNEDQKIIYIGDVPIHENGIKKGYFCLGCKRQMQAVKGNKRKQHFKHHVRPHSTEKKCSYHDETYRHKLAKDLIQIVGKLKVPAVYKFDPDKKSNQALLIKESHFIDIENVLIERNIYENENGEIEITLQNNSSKNLLIKPDAIILDSNHKPILIVEFVATHKPDIDKLIKLKRLGIDAIQISIPKSSPEDIEKCFSITEHTKWLFNNEESNTDYVEFSNKYSGAIFEVDEQQRKLFEEGFKCRSAEIGDLIRTIERLLETESYKRIEQNLRSEISRVEGNTRRESSELDELRRKFSEAGIEKHRTRRKKLSDSETEFDKEKTDLERRYFAKNEELGGQIRSIEQQIAEFEYQTSKDIRSGSSISNDIEREKNASDRIREELSRLGERKEEITRSIEFDIKRERDQIQELPRENKTLTIRIKEEFRNSSEHLQQNIKRLQHDSERIRVEFESRARQDKERLLLELEKGESSTDEWITNGYKELHDFTNALVVYKEALERNDRARQRNT